MATPYATPDAIRLKVPDIADTDKFPDDLLVDLIADFEKVAEQYRGIAYTTRTLTETWIATYWNPLDTVSLSWPQVQSITSVTLDGQTLASGTDYLIEVSNTGRYRLRRSWFVGWFGTLVVTYNHGCTTVPTTVMRALYDYVRAGAMQNKAGVPRDVISQTLPGGGSTRYSTPDITAGRPTGYIDVDRRLNSMPDFRALVQ